MVKPLTELVKQDKVKDTTIIRVTQERLMVDSISNEFEEELCNHLITENTSHYCIDFTKTEYAGPMALGTIISFHQEVMKRNPGGRVSLVINDPSFVGMFDITCLRKFFPIYESLDEFYAGEK